MDEAELREIELTIEVARREWPRTTWSLMGTLGRSLPVLVAEVRRLRKQIAWLEKERTRLKDELGEDDHSGRFDEPGLDY